MQQSMMIDIDKKPEERIERMERTSCNFQQLFKIQMMKRQRKAAYISTLSQDPEEHKVVGVKERSNHIVNLLLNCPSKNKEKHSPETSRNTPTAASLHIKPDPLLAKSLKDSKNLLEVGGKNSHSEIKVGDGVWRIKQLNKAFDREKLSLLQRYKGKMRRRVFSTQASNLLGTSISPLAKEPLKRITNTRHHTKQAHQKTSFRYRDIPISEFIYESNLARSESSINRGIQRRLQELCRRKNSRTVDHLSLQM